MLALNPTGKPLLLLKYFRNFFAATFYRAVLTVLVTVPLESFSPSNWLPPAATELRHNLLGHLFADRRYHFRLFLAKKKRLPRLNGNQDY